MEENKLTPKQINDIEQQLFDAFRAFHDLDNIAKKRQYCKEFFDKFCKKNKIDKEEALRILKEMFEDKRRRTMFKYPDYDGDKLDEMLGLGKNNREDER